MWLDLWYLSWQIDFFRGASRMSPNKRIFLNIIATYRSELFDSAERKEHRIRLNSRYGDNEAIS